MKPVRIAALAVDELRQARTWYDARSPDLGPRLINAIDRTLIDVSENPLRFPVVHRDIRRALARPFPYGVFFRDLPQFVQVIAIVHLHRDPETWRRRE